MTIKTQYRHFFKGLAWNTFESLIYQGMLITHYSMLYHYTPPMLFGIIGVIFSTLYLMTMLANVGLDTALAPYARLIPSNKTFWNQILIPHILGQVGIYILIGIVGTLILPLPLYITTLLALLLITEGTKKTFRTLLHLTFYNSITALVEIATITTYVGTVWFLYVYYQTMSLGIVLMPLLITSLISGAVLFYYLYRIYTQLTDHGESPTNRTFIHTRLYTYGTHIGHILFSSNFLVPFFALHMGLAHAGIFKLISSIVHSITSIIYKIFGPTSQTLFAHTTDMPRHEKQQLFFTLTEQIHHVLYGLIIFFSINYSTIIGKHIHEGNTTTWALVLLFLIIQLTEHFFIAYEKFFIAHNRAALLCILSACSLSIIGALLLTPINLSPITLMSLVLIVRILTIGTIGALAYSAWGIRPAFTLKPTYIAYAVALSTLFYICF